MAVSPGGRGLHKSVDGAPRLPWIRTCLAALALCSSLIATLEAFLSSQGYRPTVPDSLELWHFWRNRVHRNDSNVIVFLGSSRITADISISSMSECLPDYQVVQLGMSGAVSCIGLLMELVADPDFNGRVVCELDTPLLERTLWSGHEAQRRYQPQHLCPYVDELLKAWLKDHVISLQSPFTLKETCARLVKGQSAPALAKFRMRCNREFQWDFASLSTVEELRRATTREYQERYQSHQFATWEALASDVTTINVTIRQLQARGGQVVFLRAPATGARWELEERYHPKRDQWDRFARSTPAVCIHFRDIPGLRACECPDESHIDYRDSPRFTRALVHELAFRHVVNEPRT